MTTTIECTRTEAKSNGMPSNCKFGVISDCCVGFWAWGQSVESAIKNAKKYFRKNKRDFLDHEGNFDLDHIMSQTSIWEVK